MTHTQTYIILGIGLFITGFGGLVIYREVQHNFPLLQGRNVLTRRHRDIELQDYIQPLDNTRDIDLSSLPQYPTSQAVINHTPIRWDLYPAPRFSHLTANTATGNTPPGYSQITDNFIHCSLENNINLDFFVWVILFFSSILIITLLIRKYGKNKLDLIIILLIFKLDLFLGSLYTMSILIPFSLFEIDFRDSFEWELKFRSRPVISYLKIQSLTQDIIKLLDSLEDEENYSISYSFISSYKKWKDKKVDPLFIDDAIIINKESDPFLITQFIMDRLDKKAYFISNWLLKDTSINSMDPFILTVTVSINIKI